MAEPRATAKPDPERELVQEMGALSGDPYAWALFSFPWGEPGTPLEAHDGPDEWQTGVLKGVRDGLLTPGQALQFAVASGHGIGKSALVSWLILWGLSTFEDTRGVVTANTGTQLTTKTWPELAKWYRMFIARHWFTFTATAIYSSLKAHEKTWRVDQITWSENNTEAFAGLHNQGKRVLLLFDEASAIPDKIWEVSEGALTDKDTEILWLCFGNPTMNTGRFFDAFNRYRHRWRTAHIDSRTAKMSNKGQIAKWAEDYGEDSDWFRVRVRGVFPNASEHQFIPSSVVEGARGRHLRIDQYGFAAKVISLDNAWTGGDEIVIMLRQGLMSRKLAVLQRNDNDMQVAGLLARLEDEEGADGVLIDLGYGTGVYSAGQQMGRGWTLVPFGGASPDQGYVNMRAYMWKQMKQWLKDGGAIEDDPVLCAELCGPEAYVVATGKNAGKVYLESKEDMKARGLTSPNRADALALTFAVAVLPRSERDEFFRARDTHSAKHEFDPFAGERLGG